MGVTIGNGEFHFVDATTETNDVVLSGGTLELGFFADAGEISGTTVEFGGTDNIWTGSAFSTVLSGGVENVFGGYSEDAVDLGGTQNVYTKAYYTFVSSGFQVANSGGYVECSYVYGNGTLFVESAASAFDVNVDGGVVAVEAGGYTSYSFVNSGHEVIAAGGASYDTTIYGGDQLVGGDSFYTFVAPGGTEVVESAGFSELATISGGVQVVFGDSFYALTEAGGTQVVWGSGALTYDGGVSSGGFEFAVTGGIAEYNTIYAGATEFVVSAGSAEYEFIYGTEVVSNSEVTSTFVLAGGVQVINGGGYAACSYVYDSGTMFVENGGSGEGTTVYSGGNEYLYGGDDDFSVVYAGGNMFVESGGVAGFAVLSGGTQQIASGGYADETDVYSGGYQGVSSGGVAVSTFIYSGGIMEVAKGASVSGSVITFGTSGGYLLLDDSQHFSGVISGLDSNPGNGADTNYLDLRDIVYGASTHLSWTQASGSGTLTVTDGSHTANLDLLGTFTLSDFRMSVDAVGGTYVYDPSPTAQASASGTTLAPHTA
jgi:autotransporter passenger strand-loop-strand repeat protein